MSLQSTALTTTVANIYTSSGTTAVTTIYVANYSTSTNATFTMYAVRSGNAASNTNKIYSNVTVLAGDTYVLDKERLMLDNGDTLQASANANSSISTTLSYTTI